jgi:hypothetical protein
MRSRNLCTLDRQITIATRMFRSYRTMCRPFRPDACVPSVFVDCGVRRRPAMQCEEQLILLFLAACTGTLLSRWHLVLACLSCLSDRTCRAQSPWHSDRSERRRIVRGDRRRVGRVDRACKRICAVLRGRRLGSIVARMLFGVEPRTHRAHRGGDRARELRHLSLAFCLRIRSHVSLQGRSRTGYAWAGAVGARVRCRRCGHARGILWAIAANRHAHTTLCIAVRTRPAGADRHDVCVQAWCACPGGLTAYQRFLERAGVGRPRPRAASLGSDCCSRITSISVSSAGCLYRRLP